MADTPSRTEPLPAATAPQVTSSLAAPPVPGSFKEYLRSFGPGIVAMILLNLAVWTLGAELLFPDKQIKTLDDLPQLLSSVLGEPGRVLFYAGIFAAIYTSIIGHAGGLWMITARTRYIGAAHRNRWWENVVMFFLFSLAVYGAFNSGKSIMQFREMH